MKKINYIIPITLIAVFANIISVYGTNDDSSVASLSQIEVIDYILYAGAALFLLGMIFILLALFLKQNKNDELFNEEPNSPFDDISSDMPEENAEDNISEENDIDTAESYDETEEEIDDEIPEEKDTPIEPIDEHIDAPLEETDEDNIAVDTEENIAESEPVESESVEPESVEPEPPSVRITFTGTNNPDLKVLEFKNSATIGRKSTNDLIISDNAVSGIHCKVYSENDEVYVEDLGSTNGTILNGSSITKEVLKSDDLLVLGKKQYRINISRSDL